MKNIIQLKKRKTVDFMVIVINGAGVSIILA